MPSSRSLNWDGVSLYVPRGCVFGLVGENGAGKTTLIKHILGLLRAENGTVRVFGLDPVADPVAVLERIGYLSEQPDLPGWMRVDELLRYTQAFYSEWDAAYAEELRERFGLNPAQRLKTLSKGQQAKAAHDQAVRGWVSKDPNRLLEIAEWTAAAAVMTNFWLAARTWRRITPRRVRTYVISWVAATLCVVLLVVLLWAHGLFSLQLMAIMDIPPLDTYRLRNLLILMALLIIPFARLGPAPAALAKNRHR